jgi:hypothetical protein
MFCGVCPEVRRKLRRIRSRSPCVRDLFDRQTALIKLEPGGFEPEIFDSLAGDCPVF